MSRHRAPKPPLRKRLTSVRGRLILAVAGLALIPSIAGTYAYWTDSAEISGGQFKTGLLDLAVGGTSADQLEGPGGTWNYTELHLDDMLPGESVARPLTVRNAGTTPLSFTAEVWSTTEALFPSLKVSVVPGATHDNAGTKAAGDRAGTCSIGGSPWLSEHSVSTSHFQAPGSPVLLQPAGTTSLCVRVAFDSNAADTLQGKTTVVVMKFSASQP